MHKRTTVLLGVVMIGGLVTGPAITANAEPMAQLGLGVESGGAIATETAEERSTPSKERLGGGGVWRYGTGSTVWSDYFHGSRCHGSSVQGKTFNSSPNRGAEIWTYAKAAGRAFQVDYAYYRVC